MRFSGVNSTQQSPQQLAGLQPGMHRNVNAGDNPLNPFAYGALSSNSGVVGPYGIAAGPPSQQQVGIPTGFAQFFPGELLAILSQFTNVTRSPRLAQRMALSPNLHAIHLLQRVPPNPIPNGTIGPNLLPRRIPGPRLSSTVPIISPVYDYGAQPLG